MLSIVNSSYILLVLAMAIAVKLGLSVLVTLLCVDTTVQGQAVSRPGPPDVCLSGPFHKPKPSPEEEEFDECLSWQNKACCNIEVPRIIDQHKARGLYNYSWDLCGQLSQECEIFIKVCSSIVANSMPKPTYYFVLCSYKNP